LLDALRDQPSDRRLSTFDVRHGRLHFVLDRLVEVKLV
jgi:hypothetical protein